MTEQGFATRAVHAGMDPDPGTGAVVPSIVQATTFVQDGVNVLRGGYEYGRAGNPTRAAFERQIAALEGAEHAVAFSTGMAAEDALFRVVLADGGRVVLGGDVYGGTYRLLHDLYGPLGVTVELVDLTDPVAVAAAFGSAARIAWLETPTNPLLQIVDIAAVAASARAAGATVIVDGTFSSPALQRPLELGADVVLHSATKYLGGHSDALGGVVVTSDADLAERVRFVQFAAGAILAPFESWLFSRGLKTLPLRMARHSANALALAEALARNPRVRAVHYPGLPGHPGHDVAARQMTGGFGGMLSIAVAGGGEAARRVAERVRLFALAESLGGVESLLCLPNEMTHASVRGTPLAIAPDVLRLSVGIEDPQDLIADLEQALGD